MESRSGAAYRGPAVHRFHYTANTALVDTGNIHLVSGLPLADAIRSTNRIGDFDAELGRLVETDWPSVYAWNAEQRTLRQTVRGYERTLRHYGGLGCILLPAGFDDVFFDTAPYRRRSRTMRHPTSTSMPGRWRMPRCRRRSTSPSRPRRRRHPCW